MPAPKDTLATGEGVSEGYCTCTRRSVRNQGAEPCQREPSLWPGTENRGCWNLSRAAGFVFAEGGTNDHVAISLRQAGKPCLLAGEQYQALTTHHGQQATLACARFNGTPQAFIVEGDFS